MSSLQAELTAFLIYAELFQIQQNSANPTCMALERCWIITQYLHRAQVIQVYFLLLLKYFGCTTNQRGIPFGYFLYLLVQGYQGSLMLSAVFIAKEAGVQFLYTHSETFLNMSLTYASLIDITFSLAKSRSSGLETTLFKCCTIRISRLLDFWLNQFSCILCLFYYELLTVHYTDTNGFKISTCTCKLIKMMPN